MPRSARKSQSLRKSSVIREETEPTAVRDSFVTAPVTTLGEGAIREESPTTAVTSVPDGAASVGDESVTASQAEHASVGADGQRGVTETVGNGPPTTGTPHAESSPTAQEVVTKGILAALLGELGAAPPEQVDALRRRLLLPPAVTLPERRRGHRKTFAWYIDEALGAAVQAKAQAEGVPPSEVAERILRQARALGWL